MKKSFRFIAAFLSTLMVITLFSFAALAEPTDTSVVEGSAAVEESSSEAVVPDVSSDTAGSSSEPTDVSSEAESSETVESSEAESSETVESSIVESSETVSSEQESSEVESSEAVSSEIESSEPESSETESSEVESSETESSEVESSETESSEAESSEVESSKPESSETESSETESSETESSKPESSKPESSKPNDESSNTESSEPEEETVNFTFVLDGPGKYVILCASDDSFSHTVVNTIENTDTDTQGGKYSETIKLKKGVTYNFTVTPALNYELDGQVWIEGSQNFSATDSPRYIKATVDTTITQKFKASQGGTDAPTSNTVSITVGNGGNVTAGDRQISGGGGSKIVVEAGKKLEFVITPDEGYELDVLRVDGIDVQVVDNKYTLENIVANATVRVLFKSIVEGDLEGAIGNADVDWNAETISIDVSGGKKVLLEVFESIANLPKGDEYVEFTSEHGTIYVPYGAALSSTSAAATMSFECVESGTTFESIRQGFADVNSSDIPFKVYSFNIGMSLPEGTLVSFNLGGEFASSTAMYLLFDSSSETEKFFANSDIPPESDALGNSGRFNYSNESVVIISKEFPGKYTVQTILLNGVGGTLEPNGIVEVPIGQNFTVAVNADEGYSIKQILVNGVAVENIEGEKSYTRELMNIKENFIIEVEFKSDMVVSVPDEVITNEEKEDYTVLVILIIAFVAIAGAAALFIVKWRQEKF